MSIVESSGREDAVGGEKTKIFVGGLSQDTDNASLRKYFESWGEINDAVVMYDSSTKRSRGFGFVTFVSPDAVASVMEKTHNIDGKDVECKKACPREQSNRQGGGGMGQQFTQTRTDKIFVGGLPDLTQDEFRGYFEGFGKVVDAVLMHDRNSNRPRGFGFVTFENPDVVEEVIKKYKDHHLKDKWVEVKRAQPRDPGPRSAGGGGGFERGGRSSYDNRGSAGYRGPDAGPMHYGPANGDYIGQDPMYHYQSAPMGGYPSHHVSRGMQPQGVQRVPYQNGYDSASYGMAPQHRHGVAPHEQHQYGSMSYGLADSGYHGQGYGGVQAASVSEPMHYSPLNTQSLSQPNGQSYQHHPGMGYGQPQQYASQQYQTPHASHGHMNVYSPPHSRETSGMGLGGQMHEGGGYGVLGGNIGGYGQGYGQGMQTVGHMDQGPPPSHHQGGFGLGGMGGQQGVGSMNPYGTSSQFQDQQIR